MFLTVLSLFVGLTSFSSKELAVAKNGTLTITFKAINTIEGYDHISRMGVYCDDKLIQYSTEKKQSIPNSVTISVPRGNHTIKCVLEAKYNDKWELRTIANDYSFDWIVEKDMKIKKKQKMDITFDIKPSENNVIVK